jgi:hypothetical protein
VWEEGRTPSGVQLMAYTLFHLGQTVMKNVAAVLVTRLLCGFFACALLNNCGSLLVDLWDAATRRPTSSLLFATILSLLDRLWVVCEIPPSSVSATVRSSASDGLSPELFPATPVGDGSEWLAVLAAFWVNMVLELAPSHVSSSCRRLMGRISFVKGPEPIGLIKVDVWPTF